MSDVPHHVTSFFQPPAVRICDSTEYERFPKALPLDHPRLADLRLGSYGVLCLERCWEPDGRLTKLWLLEELGESDCEWTMTSMESTFGALYHFF